MFNLSKLAQAPAEVSSVIGDAASQVEQGYESQTAPGANVQNPIRQDTLQEAADTDGEKSLLSRMGGLDAFNYFIEEMKAQYGPSVEAIKTQLLNMPRGNHLMDSFTNQGRAGLEGQVADSGDFSGIASMAPLTDEVGAAKRQIEQFIQGVQRAEQNKAEMLANASFNLKDYKTAQMGMEQMGAPAAPPMPAPMPAPAPMDPSMGAPEETEGQFGRFPVENEGDFISKFAEDLLNYENTPGTPNYAAGKKAVEEILAAVSPGYEAEADSILESIMQLAVIEKEKAANSLIKLYEVLLPRMMKSNEVAQEPMEPVMSENNMDAIQGIVRFSLTDSVLNNQKTAEKRIVKVASDQFGQQYLLYGPSEKRICPKLRGKNMSVGDVVSEYTCRHHCTDGIVIDDNKTICGEALWRANVMDKYSREYVNADGKTEGGYLNKRFETNRNVPEDTRMRLKPGETRKPMPASCGSTESRLQDMRSKEGQKRDYRPETNTGNPFEWCHDVDQNNVQVSQKERDSRAEAAGHKLVQYTNRDQAENNPKVAFNLKQHKTSQYKPMPEPMPDSFSGGEYDPEYGNFDPEQQIQSDPMNYENQGDNEEEYQAKQEILTEMADAIQMMSPEEIPGYIAQRREQLEEEHNNMGIEDQDWDDLQRGNFASNNKQEKTAQLGSSPDLTMVMHKKKTKSLDSHDTPISPSQMLMKQPGDVRQRVPGKATTDGGKPMKKKQSGFNLHQFKTAQQIDLTKIRNYDTQIKRQFGEDSPDKDSPELKPSKKKN